MSRSVQRNRRILGLMIVAVILAGGGAAALWARTRLAPDLAAEARAAYARRDWKGTDRLARERLKRFPDDATALRLAARAAGRLDRDEAAIAIYSRLFLEDMDAEDLFLLGRALNRAGKPNLAYKIYQRARLVDPDHPETLDAVGQLYLQEDRANAAEEVGERLVRRPGWEAQGLLILATAREELNDPAGSARALGRFFELDPEGRAAAPSPVRPFRLLWARSLLKARRPAEARRVLGRVLADGPDADASWLLGRAAIQERDWDRADALLEAGAPYRAEQPFAYEPAPYVGAARCAACHAELYRSSLASKHATTFSRPRDLDGLALPSTPLPDPGNPEVTHHFERRDGSIQVETRAREEVQRAVIEYAFGSRDQFMTFVGRDGRGRSRMLRISHYESPRGSGWDLATGLPKRPEDPHEYLGTTMLEGDGVRRCLFCHTTNFRAVLDQAGPEAADRAIGCEKCHGPGGHHLAAVEVGFTDPAILNPGRLPSPASDKACSQCHGFHDKGSITAPRTDPVWYRFQSLSLTWSRCYAESDGALTCVTCHDPHSPGKAPAARQEAKCLSCHGLDPVPPGAAPATPSASTPGTRPARPKRAPGAVRTTCPVDPAKGCIGCHMPNAWYQPTHSYKTDHFIRVRERDVPEE